MDLIRTLEGFRNIAYKDTVGVWTIGYGSTYTTKFGRAVEEGDFITKEEASLELQKFISTKIEPKLAHLSAIRCDLDKPLRESLTSLAYNVGNKCLDSDNLLKFLITKNQEALKEWFMLYKWAGGKVSTGLINRRTAEVENWYGKIWHEM